MNIKGKKYECLSEFDAIEWIQNDIGQMVKRCVCPTLPENNYFITQNGILYGCRYFPRPKKYVVHQVKKCEKAIFDGILYHICTIDGVKRETAERLVYCTWVLGYWSKNIKLIFKDGNRNNVCLGNLELRQQRITSDMSDRMQQFSHLYRKEFNCIVHNVAWTMMIREDDAKDYVDDTFIKLVGDSSLTDEQEFIQKWVRLAQKTALQVIQIYERRKNIDFLDWQNGTNDTYVITNLLDVLKDKKQRKVMELVADGYSHREIGNMIGLTRSGVQHVLEKARVILKKYLSADYELMQIYNR